MLKRLLLSMTLAVLEPFFQVLDIGQSLLQIRFVAKDAAVLGHGFLQFLGNLVDHSGPVLIEMLVGYAGGCVPPDRR